MRLTDYAHDLIRPFLWPGGLAVDATAGNGHDTAFLAEQLGPDGTVCAFDVQAAAIAATRERVAALPHPARLELHQVSHTELTARVPGLACAIVFNLGYLPGGDKRITTRAEDTRIALDQARGLLAAPGILCVVAYPGHPAGRPEADTVAHWFADQACPEQIVGGIDPDTPDDPRAPRLYYLQRLA
jgi:predicted methyltransferase